MKKFIYLISCLALLGVSCSKDNYSEPEETFRGKFVDKETGEPFQTAIGNTGIRIRMMEYSWSDNPQPYDFYAKQDGTFQNTKVFAGEYACHGANGKKYNHFHASLLEAAFMTNIERNADVVASLSRTATVRSMSR